MNGPSPPPPAGTRAATRPGRVPSPRRIAWLAGAGMLLLVAVGVRFYLRDPSVPVVQRDGLWRPVESEYAGTQACVLCHGGIVNRQKATAHAASAHQLAVGEAPGSYVNGQEVRDPLTGAVYRVYSANGRLYEQLRSGPVTAEAPIEWEFGSGRQAHGYLVRVEGEKPIDCRLNWYRKINGWDFASGQDKPSKGLVTQPLGRSLSDVAGCFGCHSTQVWATGAKPEGVRGEQLQIHADRIVPGVTCEACHGPRARHVALVNSRKPRPQVAAMTAGEINRLCGSCHSTPDVRPDHAVLSRLQPWGLERSECYIRSVGKMSCLTCHDPHEDARRDAAYYDGRCRSCHSPRPETGQTAAHLCPVNRTSGCVSCHMPRDSRSMLHVTFTDHRIRRPEKKPGGTQGQQTALAASPLASAPQN